MAQVNLPISRVLDVAITRSTLFPTERGFGTLLIVTEEVGTGAAPVDATTRTKLYSDAAEVAVDYGSAQETYLAAIQAFSVTPAPLFIKIGFRTTATSVVDELDLIEAYDDDWYGLVFTKEMRDSYAVATVEQVPLVAAWTEARIKMYNSGTNNALTEGLADPTLHVAGAMALAGWDRSAAEYHHDSDKYLDVAAMARLLRTNFNAVDSTITLKFKRLPGITPIQRSSGVVTKITGFVPGQGHVINQGNFANTYVTIGGKDMYVEGNMASGEWKDTMHGVDWLQSRIASRVFGVLTSKGKVPYTNKGVQELVDQVGFALEEGIRNGLIATGDLDDNGDLIPPYEIIVDRVSTVPVAQRSNRVAPTIQLKARLAGAIHYGVINGNVTV